MKADSLNYIGKSLLKVAVLLGIWSVAACAHTGSRVGVHSPLSALGTPLMMQTSLGKLAVWDTGTQNTSLESVSPPIVLWPSIFSDHMIYTPLIEHWRGKRRVILIDGPGHGASDGPKDKTFTMQACAVAMREILDGKAIQAAVVGGTSWGGLVGGEFAILYPERTLGVVMMNTPFFVSPTGASAGEKFITWGAGAILGTNLFTNGVARAFFLPATREAGGPVISHFHNSLHQSDPKALSNAIRSVLIERIQLADRLETIKTPSLVIAGLKDDMYPLEMQREAAKKLPRGVFEMVDSQHISVVDKPLEVARLIDTFLDRTMKGK
jgi:3-oxoadipate enol-lactonase